MSETLKQRMAFIIKVDELKAVKRKARIKSDGNRFENTAEHSWHLVLSADVLFDYAALPVDKWKVMQMLLVHDIVEIEAGDTFAFAQQADLDQQHAIERQAAESIFGLLPKEQGQQYLDLWLEFEALTTPEAQFAKALDCIMPFILNMNNNGGSWVEHQISVEQVLKRNRYLKEAAPELYGYLLEQIDVAIKQGWLTA